MPPNPDGSSFWGHKTDITSAEDREAATKRIWSAFNSDSKALVLPATGGTSSSPISAKRPRYSLPLADEPKGKIIIQGVVEMCNNITHLANAARDNGDVLLDATMTAVSDVIADARIQDPRPGLANLIAIHKRRTSDQKLAMFFDNFAAAIAVIKAMSSADNIKLYVQLSFCILPCTNVLRTAWRVPKTHPTPTPTPRR